MVNYGTVDKHPLESMGGSGKITSMVFFLSMCRKIDEGSMTDLEVQQLLGPTRESWKAPEDPLGHRVLILQLGLGF